MSVYINEFAVIRILAANTPAITLVSSRLGPFGVQILVRRELEETAKDVGERVRSGNALGDE